MDRTSQLIEALRGTGYRITPQRIAICRVLAESKEHPSPQAIFRQISEKFPGISQATVYNTLTVLRDLGEVVEVGLGQDRTHYEPDPAPHANLICVRCGKIEDIEDPQVEALSSRLASEQGLRIKAAHMDIYGFCAACEAFIENRRTDAPALAAANVGIAMGAAGSDVALEMADVVLMSDDLTKIPYVKGLSKRAQRVVFQNLAFALLVIATLVTSNLLVGVPLPLGVVGHEGSTLVVVANGLRLLRGASV